MLLMLCRGVNHVANKELARDLIVKAKQVEYLIESLPEPEPEEEQVSFWDHIWFVAYGRIGGQAVTDA